jgi:hypothetical protein
MGQADFAERSVIGARQWNGVSQELSRRSLEVDQVQANVNGLRRMLRDDAQRGVARDPVRTQRFQQELDANERDPAFCFGHGLSYGAADWGVPSGLPEQVDASSLDAGVELRVPLRNDGDRTATEVVQCYVAAPAEYPGRPVRELRAFDKVRLAPGEQGEAVLRLDRRSFSRWDPESGTWALMAGTHTVVLGRSSRDLPVDLHLDVRE